MNHYLVKLQLQIGEDQKNVFSMVRAPNELDGQRIAMERNCSNEPDFSEYPDGNGCWDGADYIYTVVFTKLLTEQQADRYSAITTGYEIAGGDYDTYLVHIELQLGEDAKRTYRVVEAKTPEGASRQALQDECCNTPDFDDYPDGSSCWDGGVYLYTVLKTRGLSAADVEAYREITTFTV